MKTLYLLLCIAVMVTLFACDRTTTHTEEIFSPSTCAQCHDAGNLITGKQAQWDQSVHGTGTAYLRGTSTSCAGCHSGNAFAQMVKAGLDPDELAAGDPDPTRQDCRACHRIHETYTSSDFALRTAAPVTLYAGSVAGQIYDGGKGNLCANCHQPRRTIPAAVNDTISGISSHWGPHHGAQVPMVLGVAGAGVAGTPHPHYGIVANTCVTCHMGDESNHTFDPDTDRCEGCHPDIGDFDDFDYRGRQTEILALADLVGAELVNLGLVDVNSLDGHPIVSQAEEDQAIAMWNWIFVAHEDKSNGVHNYPYAKALLEESLTRLGLPIPRSPSPVAQARNRPGSGGSK